MSFFYLSILLSVIIGVMIIARLRSFDIYEKEAFTSLSLAFIIGGSVSVAIALLFYELLGVFGLDETAVTTVAGSFLIIGPVEELAKLAGLALVYVFIRKQFNEVTDGVIYMSCVALGFSITENFFYANMGENSQHLLIFRAFISTPAHISFSCMPGYAFYRFMKEGKPFRALLYAFIIASILHGLFDALAFLSYVRFLLIIFLWFIIHQSLRIIQYSNVVSPFRPSFGSLLSDEGSVVMEEAGCPYCHTRGAMPKYSNTYFSAFRCTSCDYHFTSVRNIGRIFRYFAPEYKRFRKKLFPVKLGDGRRYQSVYGAAFFEEGAVTGFFRTADLAERLALINKTTVDVFKKINFIPKKMLSGIID